jgi:hypothetical protein
LQTLKVEEVGSNAAKDPIMKKKNEETTDILVLV